MFSQGIPIAAFEVTDIASEFARLTRKGVAFTRQPTEAGAVTLAVFTGTCASPYPATDRAPRWRFRERVRSPSISKEMWITGCGNYDFRLTNRSGRPSSAAGPIFPRPASARRVS